MFANNIIKAKIEIMSKQLSAKKAKLLIEQSKIEEEFGSIQPEIDVVLELIRQFIEINMLILFHSKVIICC